MTLLFLFIWFVCGVTGTWLYGIWCDVIWDGEPYVWKCPTPASILIHSFGGILGPLALTASLVLWMMSGILALIDKLYDSSWWNTPICK